VGANAFDDDHKKLIYAEKFQSMYRSGESTLSTETLNFLKDWLAIHIQPTERAYSIHLNTHGIR
jgi:hemerythrin